MGKYNMSLDAGTAVEIINLFIAIGIIIVAKYAMDKFKFVVFRKGWYVIALSGVLLVAGSVFRAYYSYTDRFEPVGFGRLFILVHMVLMLIGIYLLATTAVKLWGE